MTATKYALVPVVATEQQIYATSLPMLYDTTEIPTEVVARVYSDMLAAAPKELPEEVVERVAKALYYENEGVAEGAWEREMNTKPHGRYRSLARAALLAVVGD